MTDQLKFFSEEWCAAAAAAHEGDLARRQAKALKDPANFNRVLAFSVTERPDLVTHVEIVAGRVVNWTATDFYPDDRIFASFRGATADFREAAEGRTPAANLVMGGKVRLVKGTMKDAIENAKALNVLIGAWGDLPTDWDV
ncbi:MULTISPECIES: hypothetical protein [Nocardioides]|uniref:SCP2 domain-containing protein n=1 Tax=Nocardioides vastitatis TaxID=2568655 RepID=A0ABW0ZSA5_9ACTN|nr:hypothetical protein [Nocardioides sp.]THJ16053.1 hypothetical protein E7Z54_00385 [Nocardioides sp.]